MSKQATILLVIILLFLVLTVFLFRTTRIFMIGIVLLLLARKLNQLVNQFREDRKIERMGDYVTAYKLAKDWGIPEETIADWCQQGRVLGAFKNANLWLIPRDITINGRWSSFDPNAQAKAKIRKGFSGDFMALHESPSYLG